MELVTPLVKEYCDRREMGVVHYDRPQKERGVMAIYQGGTKVSPSVYSALEALAFEAGVQPATVRRVYKGSSSNKHRPYRGLKFNTVDRLLTAMGMMYLWYEEPFSDYYKSMA